MKKTFSLTRLIKFAAIIAFAAMLFTGCENPSGGDSSGSPDSGYQDGQDEPGGQGGQGGIGGQGGQGGQGGIGGQGGQGGQGGGGQGGNGDEKSTNTLTNTTWLFEKFDIGNNTCTKEHKTSSGGTGGQDDPHVTIHTIVKEHTESRSESKTDEIRYQQYFHVDKDNNVYLGTIKWVDSYTRTWEVKIQERDDGKLLESVVDGSETITSSIPESSIKKTYDTYAIGKVESEGSNLKFTFTYLNNSIEDPTSYEKIKPVTGKYLSVYENTANDKNDNMHYYGFLNDRGYVVATKSGSSLNLEYAVKTEYCKNKAPDGSLCSNPITNKSSSVWTKTDLKDEMLDVAEVIKGEDSVKGKEFIKENLSNSLGSNYETITVKVPYSIDDAVYHYGFEADEYYSQTLKYWGYDYCYFDDSNLKKSKYAVSKYDGKYYLVANFTSGKEKYEFQKAEDGKDQDFTKFTGINNSLQTYVVTDKLIKSEDSIYSCDKFKGNTYQYQKDFIANKEWYKQAGIWKDTSENKLECTGLEKYNTNGRKGYQIYKLFGKELKNVGIIGDDKYLILLNDTSYILEDKKDKTIEITDSENNKTTLTFDSRYGYNADNITDVVLNFENDKVKFPAFESSGSTYKLPKAMTIAELKVLYAKVAALSNKQEAVASYTDKGEAITATTIGSLENTTLYLYSKTLESQQYGDTVNIDEYLTGDEPELEAPKTDESQGQGGSGESGGAQSEEGDAQGEGGAGDAGFNDGPGANGMV